MEVNPEKQNINQLFSTTNYYIDFYQREYKWTGDEVKRLLDDIFYHFELSYAKHSDLDASELLFSRVGWYALYPRRFKTARVACKSIPSPRTPFHSAQ